MNIRRCAECVHQHCLSTQTQRLRLLCLTVACWALATYTFHAAILDGVAPAQQDYYIDEVHQRANERMRRRAEELEKELQLLAADKKEREQHAEEERLGDSTGNSTVAMEENALQQPAVDRDQENLPN